MQIQKFTVDDWISIQSKFVTRYLTKKKFGVFLSNFFFVASNAGCPRIVNVALGQVIRISQPYYFEHVCLRNYFKHFRYTVEFKKFKELEFFKFDFWKSFVTLNPVYTNIRTFWFIRIENFYLRNSLCDFSLIDYLHTTWFTGNYLREFKKSEFLLYESPYLDEFTGEINKPNPFSLPSYALVKIINRGFSFGIEGTPHNLVKIWHKLFTENLARLKKNEKWIPYTRWQVPVVFKLSRKKKNLLHERRYIHKQRLWRWRERHLQLILIEDYNRRIQPMWKQLFPRLIFYSK